MLPNQGKIYLLSLSYYFLDLLGVPPPMLVSLDLFLERRPRARPDPSSWARLPRSVIRTPAPCSTRTPLLGVRASAQGGGVRGGRGKFQDAV